MPAVSALRSEERQGIPGLIGQPVSESVSSRFRERPYLKAKSGERYLVLTSSCHTHVHMYIHTKLAFTHRCASVFCYRGADEQRNKKLVELGTQKHRPGPGCASWSSWYFLSTFCHVCYHPYPTPDPAVARHWLLFLFICLPPPSQIANSLWYH